MADNQNANPGAGGALFRLLQQAVSGAYYVGQSLGFITGGSSGAWTFQDVSGTETDGLPVNPEGGPFVQSLTNANANATHGATTTARGGRKDWSGQVIVGGTTPPTGAVVALELDLTGAGNWVEATRADFGSSALNAVAPGLFLSSNNVVARAARLTLVTIAGGTAPVVNGWVGAAA